MHLDEVVVQGLSPIRGWWHLSTATHRPLVVMTSLSVPGSNPLQLSDSWRPWAGLGASGCCVIHPPPPEGGSCRSQGQMPSLNKVLGHGGGRCPPNRLGSLPSQTWREERGKRGESCPDFSLGVQGSWRPPTHRTEAPCLCGQQRSTTCALSLQGWASWATCWDWPAPLRTIELRFIMVKGQGHGL